MLQSPSACLYELIKKDFVLLLNPFPSQRLTSRCFCAAELMRRSNNGTQAAFLIITKRNARAEVSLLALFFILIEEMLFADAQCREARKSVGGDV
jgi:tRNA U34 5-methylaminomethyl-2-thiouridine-forming methyltransferase MnmC